MNGLGEIVLSSDNGFGVKSELWKLKDEEEERKPNLSVR